MPNLSAHLGMAKEAASRLEHPVINRNLGAFLLGSVTPDIRIITKGKRDDTHFVDLDFNHMGDGLDGMFRQHPRLADAGSVSEATAAFVVGYASHLLSDELWILGLYRPYFGNREVYEDAHQGDLMDRALQLELDRREQLALGGLETLRPHLSEAEKDVEIGFIPPHTMCEWREWIEGTLSWSFSWERLRFMARRVVARRADETDKTRDMVEEFLESVPRGLERIYKTIDKQLFEEFRERSIDDVMAFSREYLP